MSKSKNVVDMGTAVKIWWSWVWRVIVWGLVSGLGLGIILGVTGTIAGIDEKITTGVITLVSVLLSFPISIWCLQKALNKHFLSLGEN